MTGFSKIGLHLDLRVQVPPLPALRRMAQEAAELGVNTLIVEWEASFPFDRHAVISGPLAYTPDEVREFLCDCAHWGLDVIPLQQCFGHVEYILRHERYAGLRESESDLCQVCPCHTEEALVVFRDIFQEIGALHESPYFHIGGDETYLLGDCPRCQKRVQTEGKSGLYVTYFKRLAEEVIRQGRRPLLWIDMLLKYPEAAAEMPGECVFVDWNYGWPVDRFGDFAGLSALPFEFWGAVAMRSAPDNHSSHAWVAHLQNLRDYVPVARSMGFRGLIMTSWSTSGVYGYDWENVGRPLALHPVRRVTPHAGLKILMKAFAQAAFCDAPLDGRAFLLRYAKEQFGLTEAEAENFREALLLSDRSTDQTTFLAGAPSDAPKARLLMEQLQPQRREGEFERYRHLVLKTEHYERVLKLENEVQSERYKMGSRKLFAKRAQGLLEEGEKLADRFEKLYAGELYPTELRQESDYHLRRIRSLVERTAGLRPPARPATEPAGPPIEFGAALSRQCELVSPSV